MMKKPMIFKNLFVAILVLLFVVPSCAPLMYKQTNNLSGAELFDSPQRMETAYDAVVIGKTKAEGLEQLGFRLNKAQRLGSLEAYGLLRKSDPQFTIPATSLEEYKKLRNKIDEEKRSLSAYVFKEQRTSCKESRFYISTKKNRTTGHEYRSTFILKNDVVIYKDFQNVPIDETKKGAAFLDGAKDIIIPLIAIKSLAL